VLHRVQWKTILHTVTGRETNWIGHNWGRNCLLKHVIKGKIERRSGRLGRRGGQLLNDLKEKRGYWKMKGEALYRSLWRTRSGRVCGPAVRRTTA